MNIEFKTDRARDEYANIGPALKIVCDYFVGLSHWHGITPVVTRVLEPIPGESGVHQAGRAVDFRNEIGVGGRCLYTDAEALDIVAKMNARFPRKDGRLVCIHHAFTNHANPAAGRAPYHFHLQISYEWALDYMEVPKAA